jgi:hypothetical protein
MNRSPNAWRDQAARDADAVGSSVLPARRDTVFNKIGREVMEHPAETAALVAMGIALSRLLRRPHTGQRAVAENARGRRGVLPLGVMAALCVLGLSA